jgi:acylphosphatase
MKAYQPTSEDVWNVLSSNKLLTHLNEPLEQLSERLFTSLDFQLIEKAALYGDELDEQTKYANDEIARQLQVAGVLQLLDDTDIKLTKQQRLERVNRFVAIIANCGRKFFRTNDYVSEFVLIGADEKLVFIDNYTRTPIAVAQTGRWSGFSHGSTLKDLVISLGGYIETGESPRLNLGNLANDPWRYGKDMNSVCVAASIIGLQSHSAVSSLSSKEAEAHGITPPPEPTRSEKYQNLAKRELTYDDRVRAFEAQGMTRSDAQGVVDAEDAQVAASPIPDTPKG